MGVSLFIRKPVKENVKEMTITPPILYTKNDKDWFVEIRVDGKQIRYRCGLNRIKDLRERKIAFKGLVASLKEKIDAGWNPLTDTTPEENVRLVTVIDAIKYIKGIKEKSARKKSKQAYSWSLALIEKWGKSDYLRPDEFTPKHAQLFMDWLMTDRNFTGKSHNNVLILMRAYFNGLMQRGIINTNPFKSIGKKPATSHNTHYTDNEMERLDRWLKENNLRLYFFKEFIYCAGIRRTELTRLKVKDIGKDTITIPADAAKNKKQESVSINKRLRGVIEQMELDKYSPNDYLFGRGLNTCDKEHKSPDLISKQHLKAIQECEIRDECGLYSWKHTGAIRLYNATKDLYLVMRHLRHADSSTTLTYLKSLGVSLDTRINEMEW